MVTFYIELAHYYIGLLCLLFTFYYVWCHLYMLLAYRCNIELMLCFYVTTNDYVNLYALVNWWLSRFVILCQLHFLCCSLKNTIAVMHCNTDESLLLLLFVNSDQKIHIKQLRAGQLKHCLWQTVTQSIAIMRMLAEYIPGSVVWDRIGAIRHFPVCHFPVRQIPVLQNPVTHKVP